MLHLKKKCLTPYTESIRSGTQMIFLTNHCLHCLQCKVEEGWVGVWYISSVLSLQLNGNNLTEMDGSWSVINHAGTVYNIFCCAQSLFSSRQHLLWMSWLCNWMLQKWVQQEFDISTKQRPESKISQAITYVDVKKNINVMAWHMVSNFQVTDHILSAHPYILEDNYDA